MNNKIELNNINNFYFKGSTDVNYLRFFITFCAHKTGMDMTPFVNTKLNIIGNFGDYIKYNPKRIYHPDGRNKFKNLYTEINNQKVDGLVIDDTFITDFISAIKKIDAMPQKWNNKNIDSSNFYDFLFNLMEISARHPLSPQKTSLEQNRNSNYIEQSIHPTANNSLKYNIDNLYELLNRSNRICLIGEGGLGKTTFLKQAKLYYENKKEKQYQNIIHIQLRDELSNETSQNENEGVLLSYINRHYTMDKNASTLILLDGLDEFLSHANQSIYGGFSRDLEEISQWHKAHIIITSRYKPTELIQLKYEEYTLTYIPMQTINELLQKYKPHKISRAIKVLLKIPMYYEMFRNLETDDIPKNRYELFRSALKKLYNQRYRNNSTPKYHFIYFYLMPKITLYLCNHTLVHNGVIGNFNNLAECINEIRNKSYAEHIEYDKIYHEIGIRTFSSGYGKEETDAIIKILLEDGLIASKCGKYCLGEIFYHENWRAFLSAFSLYISIECLRENFDDDKYARECDINLNVPGSTTNMICELFFPAYLSVAEDQIAKQKKKEKLEKQFSAFFEKLPVSLQYDQSKCGYIKFAHLAFQLAGNFQFERVISEGKESVYYEIIKRGFDAIDDLDIEGNCNYRKEVIELTTKMAELSRKAKDYEQAKKYIERGLAIVAPSGDKYEIASILNQKAKVAMFQHQDTYAASSNNDALDNNAFYDAFRQLKECAEYFTVSANLYGRMLTTPALYIVEAKLLEPDPIEAFWAYYNCGIKRIGRYLTYTIRQGLSLLLRGIVRIRDDYIYRKGSCAITRDALECADYDAYKINSNTLALATDMCKLISNRSLGLIDYLIGTKYHMEYLHTQKDEYKRYAISYFSRKDSDGNPVTLSTIRKKQLEHLNYTSDVLTFLTEQNKKIKNAIDQADRLHPIYTYVDVKNLVLSYEHYMADTTKLTYYSQIFKSYEDQLSPLLRKIIEEFSVNY